MIDQRVKSMPRLVTFLLLFLLFQLSAFTASLVASPQETPKLDWLTPQEREFLKQNPTIRIAPTPSYPPFEYWTPDDRFQGVVSSYLDRFESELGIEFEMIQTESWDDNLEKLKKREIDAVSLIVPWTDRDYVSVSEPYISYPSMIFVRSNQAGDLSLKDLAGKRVAVPDSYTGEAFLRRNYPEIIVVEARDPADGVRMLATGEVDAFFGGAGVVAFIAQREGFVNLRIAGESDFQYRNGLGVRSDWPLFANIISKTLNRITPAMHSEYHARWVSDSFFRKRFYQYKEFWLAFTGGLGFVFLGVTGMIVWNRRQAAFIDELEAEQTKTEHARVEAEHARREAEAANQAKSMFVATISHEIRTPMNGVLGMCELLRSTGLDNRQTEYLNYASSSAKNLVGLINDILDFSKMEAGKLEFDPQPFSLQKLLDDVTHLMRTQTQAKGLVLNDYRSKDLGDVHIGDSMRIRQVLVNLIGNAIKFTAEGQISLKASQVRRPSRSGVNDLAPCDSITLPTINRTFDENGKEVSTSFEFSPNAKLFRFEVSDTGVGIAKDKVEDIFKPFEQEHAGTSKTFGGTGLGLSICQMLAEKMGGKTEVTSQLGKGSTFSFTVLLDHCDLGAEELLTAKESNPTPTDSIAARCVLLAEDGIVNQKVAVGLLELRGHRVDVVSNGEEAVEAVNRNRYDAILMDIEMPKMDGLEAIRKIRSLESHRSSTENNSLKADVMFARNWVIAITGHAMTGDRERFLAAGFDAHLVKPFHPEDLYSLVEQSPIDPNNLTTLQANDSRPVAQRRGDKKNVAPVGSVPKKSLEHASGPDPSEFDSNVLNRQVALKRTGGDVALANVLLETCIADVPNLLAAARAGIANSDYIVARRCGHSLRTSFANVGAGTASASAQGLEYCEDETEAAFSAKIQAIEKAFEELKAAV